MTLLLCPHCQFGLLDDDAAPCTACGKVAGTGGPDPGLPARFRELAPHPRGRWGTRWRGVDGDTGRAVILQVIPLSEGRREEEIARFDEGFAVARALLHPHLAAPIAAGHTAASLWFAVESCDFPTLNERLSAGPLTPAELQKVAHQLASGLDYAHRCGVGHGALTPDDILVSPAGWVLVEGVGIAAALGQGPEPWSAEHLEAIAPLGAGADQRALAAIIETCLSGPGPIPVALPPRVAEVVARAQAPRPVDRYPDLLAMVGALDGPEPLHRPAQTAPPPLWSNGPPAWSVALFEPMEPPKTGLHRHRTLLSVGVGAVVVMGSLIARAISHEDASATLPGALPSAEAFAVAVPEELEALANAPVIRPPSSSARSPEAVPRPSSRPTPRAAAARVVPRPAPTPRNAGPAPALPPAPLPGGDRPAVPVELIGYLSVSARPWGTLAVDGVVVGDTPRLDLPIAAGPHTLRITRDGYAPLETTVTITAGERRVVAGLQLKELAP